MRCISRIWISKHHLPSRTATLKLVFISRVCFVWFVSFHVRSFLIFFFFFFALPEPCSDRMRRWKTFFDIHRISLFLSSSSYRSTKHGFLASKVFQYFISYLIFNCWNNECTKNVTQSFGMCFAAIQQRDAIYKKSFKIELNCPWALFKKIHILFYANSVSFISLANSKVLKQ